VDTAMIVRNGVMVALVCTVADEFDHIARSQVIVNITRAIDARRGFTPELGYPARVRPY
jgi:hypothetical protein